MPGINSDRHLGVRRSRRYAVALPLRYAVRNADQWYEGRTVDVSVDGVRFLTSGVVEQPGTPVSLVMSLWPDSGVGEGTTVLCTGKVVRTSCAPVGGIHVMAVTIEQYEVAAKAHGAPEA